jgi:hypothetical protein
MYFSAVVFGNGIFMIEVIDSFTDLKTLLISPDGDHWIELPEEFPVLNGITFGDGSFVGVGDGGVIMQSLPEPMLSLYPMDHNFGTVYVGNVSTQVYTITNNDYGDLVLNNIMITGKDTSDFLINNDNCFGHTLVYGESATFEVVFAPTSPGSKSALLNIASTDPDNQELNLQLTGNGIGGSVTYDGNGNTSGTSPIDSNKYVQGATVTVLDNTGSLKKVSYTFDGWNAQANGTGTHYDPGTTFSMENQNVTLRLGLQWLHLLLPERQLHHLHFVERQLLLPLPLVYFLP